MSKNTRYIITFGLTSLIFVFVWAYNDQRNQIKRLESALEEKEVQFQVIQDEYQACKGEILHKGKLLEMEKAKNNRLNNSSLDSLSN
ncbi:MAG: hypothetical protein KDC84_05840 [Crocinitomicaceae bacterium]|nr:hypothetical protein [Crocinitomicaceae bacterium]